MTQEDRLNYSAVLLENAHRYLKTGILDKNLSRIITDAFEVRNEADYDVSYIISKDEVLEQIRRAGVFMGAVETYLKEQSVVIPD